MKAETIADIVREMRENEGVPVPFAPMEAVWITDFHAYADRLEAAHKREVVVSKTDTTTKESLQVGNGAKMREALLAVRKAAIYAERVEWLTSGDDGEESFCLRLDEELEECEKDGGVV